ncbi:MAG: hypothetical protein B7Z26_10910, partial [Asticcacaulis sp. 32-58-5]
TYASQWLTYGRLFSIDELVQEIDQVALDDLSRVGNSIVNQKGCASAILGPRHKTDMASLIQQVFAA